MTIQLYDLAGAEKDRRFSPFCWRIKMALAHKGLEVEEIPWCFTEKDRISFTEQPRVPVIIDKNAGDKAVWDSWSIALYLDEAYSDAPLIPKGAEASTFFFKNWVEQTIQTGIAKQVVYDVYRHIDEKDKDYFKTTREKVFGAALEDVDAMAAERLPAFQASLAPMRTVLGAYAYFGGDAPDFMDHLAFCGFAWARAISEKKLLESDDPIYAWRDRMLDAYNGFAKAHPGYDL